MAHKPLIWIGRALLVLAGIVLIVTVSLLIFRPVISLELLRPEIERTLTERLGVAVSIRDLRLRTSLWPTLLARGITIADAKPQNIVEIARADELEVQLAVLTLLRHRISLDRVGLEGLEVQVGPIATLLNELSEKSQSDTDWMLVAIRDLEAHDLVGRFDDNDGNQHTLNLLSVTGKVSQTEPLRFDLTGNLDEFPVYLEFDGPPIEDLLEPPRTIPLVATIQIGDLEADAHVALSESRFLLSALSGKFFGSSFTGALDLKSSKDRPDVEGEFHLARIDLGRWIPDEDPTPDPENHESELSNLARKAIPYEVLEFADVDLQFSIGQVVGLPTDIDDLSFDIEIRDGRARLPVQFQTAGAAVNINATVDPSDESDTVKIEGAVIAFPLERLTDFDPRFSPLEGRIGELQAKASTSGETAAELLREVAVALEISESSIGLHSPNDERSLDLKISRLAAQRSPRQQLRIDLEGVLQQTPIRVHSESANLIALKEGAPWPIALDLQSLGTELKLEATITPTTSLPIVDTSFRVSGDRIADLSNWLGIPEEADLPFGIAAQYHFDAERGELTIDSAHLGQSSFSGHALHVLEPLEHIQADIDVDLIAPGELKVLTEPLEERELKEDGLSFDLPILPKPLTLPDTEIDLTVDRIRRIPKDITNLELDLNFRQGELKPSTLGFRAGGSQIDGSIELYWEADNPTIQIEVDGDLVNLADFIEIDRIIEGYAARAEHIEVDLKAQGSTLRQLLSLNSDIGLRGDGISFSKLVSQSEKPIEFYFDQIEARGPKREPVAGRATGRINDLPIEMTFEATPRETYKVGDDLPFEIAVISNDLQGRISGQLKFPLDSKDLSADFHLLAPSISSLTPVLDAELPDVGPLEMEGTITSSSEGVRIALDELIAGHSVLQGDFVVDTREDRTRIDVDLRAETLQPTDFLPAEPPVESETDTNLDPPGRDPVQVLTELELLRQIDGSLVLEADQIVWGEVVGGGGKITVQLEDGHLTVGPVRFRQGGDHIEGSLDLKMVDRELLARFDLQMNDFHYGPLAQAFHPDVEADGTISVASQVSTAGSTLEELITSADGYLDFAVYPHGVETNLLDLWAAGLTSVIRIFNPNRDSVLNCLIGEFSIADGQMFTEGIYLDTSQIRARGKGAVDLTEKTIQMKFRPRPKRRTFLNLATPARITGPINDPNIRVTAGGFAGTAFRIYTWAVTVWFEVFRTPLPTDGSDICVNPVPRLETDP